MLGKLKKDWIIILLIVITAFLVRLVFSFSGGEITDTNFYQTWSFIGTTKGITSLYSAIGNYLPANYPPIILYLLTFVGIIYKTFFSANFVFNASTLFFLLKFFPVLFDISLGLVLYFFISSGFSKKTGLLASAFYLFNPAIIYNSSVWGQTDSILMFFLILTVIFLIKKKINYAWLFYSLSFLTKQQALIFLPLMILFTIELFGIKRLYRAFITGGAVSAIVLLPFIISRQFINFLKSITSSLTFYPVLSKNAFNVWWLLFGERAGVFSDQSIVFLVYNFQIIGLILLALVYFFIFQRIKKDPPYPKFIILSFLAISLAFFLFPTEIHERYLLYSIPFAISLLFYEKKGNMIFAVISISSFINLIYSLPFFSLNFPWPYFGQILSLLNILAFGYVIHLLKSGDPKSNKTKLNEANIK